MNEVPLIMELNTRVRVSDMAEETFHCTFPCLEIDPTGIMLKATLLSPPLYKEALSQLLDMETVSTRMFSTSFVCPARSC